VKSVNGFQWLMYQNVLFWSILGLATFSFLGHSIQTSKLLGPCPKCIGHTAVILGMVMSMVLIIWYGYWIFTNTYKKKWWLEYEYLIFWDLLCVIATPGLPMFMIWFVSMKGPGGNEKTRTLL